MEFSSFGNKLASHSGILHLMDDLGKAMSGHEKMIMMGGGNPAPIQEIREAWRTRMHAMLDDGAEFDRMLGNYDTPQGNRDFIAAVAEFFRREYGWPVGPENVAVTNGSQNAFFYLFNLFAGEFPGGKRKQILLPLSPEYIGYLDQGLTEGMFASRRPKIEDLPNHEFKYHIDFDACAEALDAERRERSGCLEIDGGIGAVCVSRPTNPTGNVLTDGEMRRLMNLTREKGVPLLVDNAYGLPFPGILFTKATLEWDEHVVLSMSLSKIGLPSARTGILLASPEVVRAISGVNAIVSLANATVGQSVALPFFRSGEIIRLAREIVNPFYRERSEETLSWLHEDLGDSVPWRVHKSEGAIFLWLNFPGLPISDRELYERLRARGVLVVPGHYFFGALGVKAAEDWPHARECIRIHYAMDRADVREGVRIIADEVRRAFRQ
jgi:valine--pyruvate aminotransferase